LKKGKETQGPEVKYLVIQAVIWRELAEHNDSIRKGVKEVKKAGRMATTITVALYRLALDGIEYRELRRTSSYSTQRERFSTQPTQQWCRRA
jgi:hypothetical protein